MTMEQDSQQIREAVREHYAEAARRVQRIGGSCGCGCGGSAVDESAQRFYTQEELQSLPEAAALASLGCGNPLLLAELKPGEVVLDLGSGGGIAVLLSARRVGPTGKAYGLDMTDEMLELARRNARAAGATNVEFLKGHIESIPLPDASVDVIISNCVINLSADKDAVLREAYRVLRPGGRFAVADIVVQGRALAPEIRQALALWAGCLAGAITEDAYRQQLAAAGFTGIDLQVLKEYTADDAPDEMCCCTPAGLKLDAGTHIVSAFIKASKPL